jgi:hypothetical protein
VTPRYSEDQARKAVAASLSYAEALRRLGMCDRGGSWRILEKWVEIWDVPVDHFDSRARSVAAARLRARPLEELLVQGSVVGSAKLKEKLYRAGLKERRCELCGQGEEWRGRRMSLILDHANGVRDDNRLENLRIVCPNCNATLDTHCGRNATLRTEQPCERCERSFLPRYASQRFCSSSCGAGGDQRGRARTELRRVERPPYEQLLAEVQQLGWEGTGRKYGVSGNAIRKWVRWYERERAREAA